MTEESKSDSRSEKLSDNTPFNGDMKADFIVGDQVNVLVDQLSPDKITKTLIGSKNATLAATF